MSRTEPEITEVYVDGSGPVWDAVEILVERSTLSQHVLIAPRGPGDTSVYRVYHDPQGFPFDYWGSGTQGLWRLLLSLSRSGYEVSVYEVVNRLDGNNTRVVAAAMAALCSTPLEVW